MIATFALRRILLATTVLTCSALSVCTLSACTSGPSMASPVAPRCTTCAPRTDSPREIHDTFDGSVVAVPVPDAIQAWMERLTVAHEYDPATGFIVAREVVPLPAVLDAGPTLEQALALTADSDFPLVVFATADRCAPCQQFKRDALNDPRIVERLGRGDLLATHIEVDREPAAAREFLGGAAIPMSYLLRDGKVTSTLRGQRTADELLSWLAGID